VAPLMANQLFNCSNLPERRTSRATSFDENSELVFQLKFRQNVSFKFVNVVTKSGKIIRCYSSLGALAKLRNYIALKHILRL